MNRNKKTTRRFEKKYQDINMQGIRAVFSALLPNVYSGTAAIILDAHPVHKNRPKLAHSFDFRAKNLFRADSDKKRWQHIRCIDFTKVLHNYGQGGYSRLIFCSYTRWCYTKYLDCFHYLKYSSISTFDMDCRYILGTFRSSRGR